MREFNLEAKMKNLNEANGGVVNHGFTVEFSSEDDDSVLNLETKESNCIPKKGKSSKKWVGKGAGERRGSGNNGASDGIENSTVVGNGAATKPAEIPVSQENFSGHLEFERKGANKGQEDPTATALKRPIPLQNSNQQERRKSSVDQRKNSSSSVIENNVHPNNMAPVKAPYTTAPNDLIAPYKVTSEALEATKTNNPKEYYRDVRLSLDVTNNKSVSSDLPQFHKCSINSKGKSDYCVKCSIYNNENSNSFDDDDDDEDCANCKRKILNNYKLVFKYIFERPLFCFCIWAVFYIYWGDDALPGGSLFALTVLEITALFLGYVAEVFQLPGLLGMIIAGIILRNVPHINVAKDLDDTLSSSLRGLSVVILLVRGGLGVNAVNIMKYIKVIPPLVIGSCAFEAIAATVSVSYIIGFPLEWASLMGCIMSAMSGIAVIPFVNLTEKNLNLKADPCTLSPNYQKTIAIARTACGLDAMISICMAEVALGFIFAEGEAGSGLMKGVVEIIMGGAFGLLWGFVAGFLIDETSNNEKRVTIVFACGIMSLIGLTKVGYPRGGPLACFAGVLLTATIWRKRKIGGLNNEQLSASFTLIWFFLQPLLFAIIGARTDFEIVDWNVVLKGLLCLAISLSVRFVVSFFTTVFGDLTIKERIYLSLAWIPKGTVQAALGPVALDTTLSATGLTSPKEYEDLSKKVMNISAATVIAAAFFGCLSLRFIAPRLLSHK